MSAQWLSNSEALTEASAPTWKHFYGNHFPTELGASKGGPQTLPWKVAAGRKLQDHRIQPFHFPDGEAKAPAVDRGVGNVFPGPRPGT